MEIQVSELSGKALDYAVAIAEGTLGQKPPRCFDCKHFEEQSGGDGAIYYCHHPESHHEMEYGWGKAISPVYVVHPNCPISDATPEPYSLKWELAGPIIEREGICLSPSAGGLNSWVADTPLRPTSLADKKRCAGSPLVAAMRCYVAGKLGEIIEIPKTILEDA